jgi:hypothetical protein
VKQILKSSSIINDVSETKYSYKISRTTFPLILTSPGRVSWLEDVEDREQLLAQGSLPPEASLIQFFSHKKNNRTISQCKY